nr:PREDICTED: uncharacterized protein LOC109041569 [Bemisia tabaci]
MLLPLIIERRKCHNNIHNSDNYTMQVMHQARVDRLTTSEFNDEDINGYGELLQKRANEQRSYPRIKVLDSFFYTSYKLHGPQRVAGRFKRTDIHALDFILIPCNFKGNHWILCVVDLRGRCIIIFDSLFKAETAQVVLNDVKRFMGYMCEKSWGNLSWINIYAAKCPQQLNLKDCGPYCLVFAEAVCRRAKMILPEAFPSGTSLQLEIMRQLFERVVGPLSESAGEPDLPTPFLWPPREQFQFVDQPLPVEVNMMPNMPSTAPIDLITPPSDSPPPPRVPEPDSLAALRRFVREAPFMMRIDRQRLRFTDGSTIRFWPAQAEEYLKSKD